MPSIRVLRHIIDKMKHISPRLMISLDSCGKMILGVSNVTATVDTHFMGLEVIGLHTGTG